MAVAVICEFNPFHNGHKYLLEKARKITGEPVIAVMSGSFTQRGEVAVTDKFERTAVAVRNGADLVVELPTVYAVANAERFARGGVRIAKSFSDVHYLAFGCETDDLSLLTSAVQAKQNPAVNKRIAALMKDGDYYPRAMEQAVREICGDEVADVLTAPNNILAVEYLRAIADSGIQPLPIRRVGAAHDSGEINGNYASASLLRTMLRSGQAAKAYLPQMPPEITRPELLERAMLFRLRAMTAADFQKLPDVGEGLENRIIEAVKKHNSIKEIIGAVKTKRYTHARLRRILVCAALGITEELQAAKASYVRVLGFTQVGAAMLRTCRFEVVTSVAKAMQSGDNRVFLEKDILATDLAALAFDKIKPSAADYLTKIIKDF